MCHFCASSVQCLPRLYFTVGHFFSLINGEILAFLVSGRQKKSPVQRVGPSLPSPPLTRYYLAIESGPR